MLATREPLEWYFKQLDHSVGLSFKANFHFALVGHLIKGLRHLSPVTVSRTTRVLTMLLDIVAKPAAPTNSDGDKKKRTKKKRDNKYEVTKDNVAYLAALVSVSEDVRSRCHVKQTFSGIMPDSPTFDSFAVDIHLKPQSSRLGNQSPSKKGATTGGNERSKQKQKSLDLMVQPPSLEERGHRGAGGVASAPPGSQTALYQSRPNPLGPVRGVAENMFCPENNAQLQLQQQEPQANNADIADQVETDSGCGDDSPPVEYVTEASNDNNANGDSGRSRAEEDDDEEEDDDGGRPSSISNENNILLDPEVLNDQVTQVLVLTVMATLVKYTTDESEVRILYEYLAEASVVFPKVFPVIHSLLDAKITNVLSLCHDKTILAAVQSIIENMIACDGGGAGSGGAGGGGGDEASSDKSQQLHFLQSCGFGGLWRFAGPFSQANCNAENVELFLNTLDALVETCLPADDEDGAGAGATRGGADEEENASYNSAVLSMSSQLKLSSSMTSLSLAASPTEKNVGDNTSANAF